jgi:hypothetical protein
MSRARSFGVSGYGFPAFAALSPKYQQQRAKFSASRLSFQEGPPQKRWQEENRNRAPQARRGSVRGRQPRPSGRPGGRARRASGLRRAPVQPGRASPPAGLRAGTQARGAGRARPRGAPRPHSRGRGGGRGNGRPGPAISNPPPPQHPRPDPRNPTRPPTAAAPRRSARGRAARARGLTGAGSRVHGGAAEGLRGRGPAARAPRAPTPRAASREGAAGRTIRPGAAA